MKLVYFLAILGSAWCAPAGDLITSLPGLSSLPSYKQYSGYLSASATKHLHYWFVQSQGNPATDPVVLWLNGGPGCSSVDTLLSENGPFHVNDDGKTLYKNPYSWNKIANVLYLEAPAGVGYSYDDNNHVATDDDQVSLHNYQALVDFFKKFPEYTDNPFYVTGESYGGIFLPTLSIRIMEGSFKINFKGFAVGNGLNSFMENDRSLVFFAYYHGLVGDSLQKSLSSSCCNGRWERLHCDFTKNSTDCQGAVAEFRTIVYNSGLNNFALYLDCYGRSGGSTVERYRHDMNLLFRNIPRQKFLVDAKRNFNSPRGNLGLVPPCINATASTAWLNRADVREALHISSHVGTWAVCSDSVSVSYTHKYHDMTAQYNQVLKDPNLRILVYNGDTDMACNFLGDEWFVEDLKRNVKKAYSPWYVDGQVAGFAKTFEGITFTTIKGAGHMVAQWAPSFAYAMFEKFLNDKPF